MAALNKDYHKCDIEKFKSEMYNKYQYYEIVLFRLAGLIPERKLKPVLPVMGG